jgi:hypothetical protein
MDPYIRGVAKEPQRLYPFKWIIYEPVRLNDLKPKGEIEKYCTLTQVKKEYYPLNEEPDLFFKFAQWFNPDRPQKNREVYVIERTLEWVNAYGPLWINDKTGLVFINEFWKAYYDANTAFILYKDFLKNAKQVTIDKKIKRDIEENPYSRVKIYNLVEESVAILNEHFIGKYINDIHPQVNITPLPDGTYKLLPQYDMPSLLSAMWWQFYQHITGFSSGELVECVACKDWFKPKGRSDEKYCSPSCRNNWNSDRSKKKIKTLELKREGKAKEEILKVLSKGKYPISMEDIDEWLKDS